MKQLKFNVLENLPSLLAKTKLTTIRKAWKKPSIPIDQIEYKYGELFGNTGARMHPEIIDKPCEYSEGEVVRAVWTGDKNLYCDLKKCNDIYRELDYPISLGKVRIVKIEKIEIIQTKVDEDWLNYIRADGSALLFYEREELARKEGFASVQQMTLYFKKYAPEIKTQAMPFWMLHLDWKVEQ